MLLKDARAFDLGYIAAWRQYFQSRSEDQIHAKLSKLFKKCDLESQELAMFQCSIIRFFFDLNISDRLHIAQDDLIDLLPPKSRERLLSFVDPHNRAKGIRELNRELNSNFEFIDEALVHYGLRFLDDRDTSGFQGKTIIDVGAYNGDSAVLFTKLYSPGEIHAFEPNSKNFEALTQSISTMGFTNNVICNKLAVGETTGVEICIYGYGLGAGSLEKESLTSDIMELAQTVSLDDYCDQHCVSNIGLIKIDAEGAGFDVVKGAIETIRKTQPYLMISVYHTPEEFFGIAEFLQTEFPNYALELRKASFDLIKEFVFICKPIN